MKLSLALVFPGRCKLLFESFIANNIHRKCTQITPGYLLLITKKPIELDFNWKHVFSQSNDLILCPSKRLYP